MSDSKSSGNLTFGDIVTVIALLVMGVFVFFGMNFVTLGDRIPSILVAVVTVVLLIVFVFLAAFAKRQETYQETWKKVQYAMLALYVVGMIPCYLFVSKFIDVQTSKEEVIKQVEEDTDNLNSLFSDYSRVCDSRVNAYRIQLESMLTTPEGRGQIAKIVGVKAGEVNKATINQAAESFSKKLKGPEYRTLESEKDGIIENCQNSFNNWNLMYLPRYVRELGTANVKFAEALDALYTQDSEKGEKNVPQFDIAPYTKESSILNRFTALDHFSIAGLLTVLFLGILGLTKCLFAPKSNRIELQQGTPEDIYRTDGLRYKGDKRP